MSHDIPIHLIDADPDQPRKHFDQAALDELAQSMQENGLAVPVLVRPVGERFMLVHGDRRTVLMTDVLPPFTRHTTHYGVAAAYTYIERLPLDAYPTATHIEVSL